MIILIFSVTILTYIVMWWSHNLELKYLLSTRLLALWKPAPMCSPRNSGEIKMNLMRFFRIISGWLMMSCFRMISRRSVMRNSSGWFYDDWWWLIPQVHEGDFISYMCDGELQCRDASDESLYQCFQVPFMFSTIFVKFLPYQFFGLFTIYNFIMQIFHICYELGSTWSFRPLELDFAISNFNFFFCCRKTCIRSILPGSLSLSFSLPLSNFHFHPFSHCTMCQAQ